MIGTEKSDFKVMTALFQTNLNKTETENGENTKFEFRSTEQFKQLIRKL